MPLRDFKVVKFLGKGSYGSVYKVIRFADGCEYAMKEINIRYMSHKEREEAVNEIRILASFEHPNIIGYMEAFVESDKLFIITEMADRGDLLSKIKARKTRRRYFSEEVIWNYLIQIATGLEYLHSQNVLHRDMKTANIFLTSANKIKIGDLGVAKLLKSETQLAKTSIGTPYYLSPEIWQNRPYNAKSDIWSLGVCMYEMITLNRPFEANSMQALARRVTSGRYAPLPTMYSKELSDLLASFLCVDPRRRPSMQRVLEHPSMAKRRHLVPASPVTPRRPPPLFHLKSTIQVPRQRLCNANLRLPPSAYPTERGHHTYPIHGATDTPEPTDRDPTETSHSQPQPASHNHNHNAHGLPPRAPPPSVGPGPSRQPSARGGGGGPSARGGGLPSARGSARGGAEVAGVGVRGPRNPKDAPPVECGYPPPVSARNQPPRARAPTPQHRAPYASNVNANNPPAYPSPYQNPSHYRHPTGPRYGHYSNASNPNCLVERAEDVAPHGRHNRPSPKSSPAALRHRRDENRGNLPNVYRQQPTADHFPSRRGAAQDSKFETRSPMHRGQFGRLPQITPNKPSSPAQGASKRGGPIMAPLRKGNNYQPQPSRYGRAPGLAPRGAPVARIAGMAPPRPRVPQHRYPFRR